jgi:hypothetical protein
MTFSACRRAGFFPAFFVGLVALDTMFCHHMLFNQFPFVFQSLDTAQFLWKKGMADPAVL